MRDIYKMSAFTQAVKYGPRSAVGKVLNCRSRGRDFDPGPAIFLPQIIYEICSGHNNSRNEVRGLCHSDPKVVRDILP